MYANVSDEFKEIVKSNSVTAVAKLVFTNPNITIYGHSTEDLQSSLQDITITDNCYSGGNLIGTAMTKEVEVKIINKDNLDLADKEFELFVGVKLANGEYEYIPYGKYITTKYEDTKSNSIFKLIAYDYMNKLNKLFKDITFNPTFPITLKDFKEQLLNACSIEYEEQTLANDNFVVSVMPNFDGMSVRSVIGKIAELQGTFAKINRNNKMEFYLKTVTDEQIDAMSMNSRLEINKKYGVVNSVSLALGGVEGENVTLQDDESIAQNGETMITITDNPFVYTQELRENAITELFNSLNGFYYVPTKFKYKARLYTDCGDSIQVENVQDGTYVESMILNQTIKIPSTRQSQIESLALSDTAIENKYISQTEQKNTHTELMVDKVNQKITSVVEQIGDRSSKTTTITQDIDGIQSQVQNIQSLTQLVSGNTSIFLENSVEGGKIIELHIFGNNQVFDALILGNNVILGNTTILGGDSIIVITDKDNNSVEYDLGIREVLRQNGDVFDEYVLINDTAKVIRRINKDGTIKENPTEEILTAPTLVLLEGDNTISIKSYQASMNVTYIPKTNFTDTFATTVEMNSAIKQSADEINLEVSRKVGEDEIISKINQTAEQIQIKADKIDINGKAVHFKTEINQEIGLYTENDLEKVTEYLLGNTTLSDEEFEKYDINGDGIINSSDSLTIRRIINEGGYETYSGTYEIDPYSYKKSFRLYDNETNKYKVILSIVYNYLNYLYTGGISIEDGSFRITDENDVKLYAQKNESVGFELFVDGNIRTSNQITCKNLVQTSLEENKKNFEKLENALELIKATDIYTYNFKTEKDTDKKHIGFVIGNDYNYSQEITAIDEEGNEIGVDNYAMTSICFKAIQEQQKIIEKLQEEMKNIKGGR